MSGLTENAPNDVPEDINQFESEVVTKLLWTYETSPCLSVLEAGYL